jgi:hypothetical protein
MSPRPLDQIDRAVLIARKAVSGGRIEDPTTLARVLYHSWFLGSRPSVPVQRTAARRPSQPWRAWGRHWNEDRPCRGADLVRLYLACAPHTTLHAISAVTARAQTWDHPWLLSSRAPNQAVPTPDATVLYLPIAALDDLREPIGHLLGELKPFLATSVPALTLVIARGAALAQNPADGRSFGAHRSSVIAESVLRNRRFHHREVIERTLESFRLAQVDPERPYRALGADWEWDRRSRTVGRAA